MLKYTLFYPKKKPAGGRLLCYACWPRTCRQRPAMAAWPGHMAARRPKAFYLIDGTGW